MLKTILTGFVLGIILILFVPSALILASWNAVPGDSTYQVKVALEKAILGITPSDNLKTTLEIKYTERRFTEVEKLINTNTTKTTKDTKTKLVDTSLTNLTNQAIASKNSLQKIQNTTEKVAQTESLISTLESISLKIEENKQTSPISTPIPTKNILTTSQSLPTTNPTSIPTLKPTLTSTPTKDSGSIEPTSTINLDNTQEIIDEIIDELKGNSIESTSDTDKTNKSSSRDIKDNSLKENNRDKKNPKD